MRFGQTQLTNWSRTWVSKVTQHKRPESETEVVDLVQRARAERKKVKVLGSLHSFSEIARPDQIAVSLDRLDKFIDLDPAAGLVTVQAGMRLKELNRILDEHEMALPILGSVSEQTVAGAISTATHGSSLSHGNLASVVQGLRLVNGQGEIVAFPTETLPAARVSLGALGVITEVTMRCVPAFRLVETTETLSFGETVDRLPELAKENEFIKLWWLPHTDRVQVFRAERSLEARNLQDWRRWLDENVINRWLFPLLLGAGAFVPDLTPAINRAVARHYFTPQKRVGRSHEIFNVPMPPRHSESEYAVDLEQAGLALHEVRRLIEGEDLKIDFIVELRFVKGDDSWMSPAFGRDTAQIGAYVCAQHSKERYFEGFGRVMKSLGGRPHWGKCFSMTPEELSETYPMAELFKAQLELHDPGQVFLNPLLRTVLYG